MRVEVRDDGGGIDVEKVRRTAVQRGLITADAALSMADEDVVPLVFAPGFSTAAAITDVSGRGVGMDAVRAAIGRLGGRVSVNTEQRQGTLVRLTVPFSVMLTRIMTIEAGGQAFGVPLDAVLETVRIPRDHIVPVGAGRAFVLRNKTIPVIGLAHSLNPDRPEATEDEAIILITAAAGKIGGIEVDRVWEQSEVMLTPMEGLLAGMPGISGTTLLGDGRVLMVLDIQELLE